MINVTLDSGEVIANELLYNKLLVNKNITYTVLVYGSILLIFVMFDNVELMILTKCLQLFF